MALLKIDYNTFDSPFSVCSYSFEPEPYISNSWFSSHFKFNGFSVSAYEHLKSSLSRWPEVQLRPEIFSDVLQLYYRVQATTQEALANAVFRAHASRASSLRRKSLEDKLRGAMVDPVAHTFWASWASRIESWRISFLKLFMELQQIRDKHCGEAVTCFTGGGLGNTQDENMEVCVCARTELYVEQ